MRILLPVYGLVLAAFAVVILFVFKAGLDDYIATNSLAATQVSAPEGWSARPYRTSDGELITQASFVANAGGTTQDILGQYEIPTGGLRDGMLTTVVRGDEMIALRLSYAPHVPKRPTLAERLGRASPKDAGDTPTDGMFATVAGLPVIEQPRFATVPGDAVPVPVNYRYFTTVIGDRTVDEVLEVSVLTNSSDAAVASVLDSLDVVALNARLPTPDPRVIASAGVLTRDPLPLSEQRPRPTPAYRAMQLLDAGEVLDPPWQDALVQIRGGEIETWNDLRSRYPKIDTLPFRLLEVLDDGSHDSAARYFAAVLTNSGRAWTGHEFHVLSKISDVGTTQADFAEYLAGEYEIAPEVLALVRRLPEAPAPGAETQVVQSGVLPATGLSNAASCVIDNGVRRCIVGGN
jgi:hypothetical protein